MIVLRQYEYRLLRPQSRLEWRTPSLAQPKTVFGHENHKRFRLTARLNDGHVAWRGHFYDREDADAFLDALARHLVLGSPMPREVWDLPTPSWFPGFGEGLSYEFATQIFVVSGTTQTSPSDWNNSNNFCEAVGGGGSGASSGSGAVHNTGGGGGEWREISNFSVATPGTTAFNYTIGSGGAAISTSGAGTVGNNGTQVTFNTSSLIAKPGLAGATGSGSRNGGAGGTGGTGAAGNNDGGRGGNLTGASGSGGSGGGGAAGSTGVGGNGVDTNSTGTAITTNGGGADTGGTGAGSAGTTPGGAGGNGTEWNASHGSGGGGAGNASGTAGVNAGDGGNYGAGGGGTKGGNSNTSVSGAGIQGILVLTYTPSAVAANYMFNLAFPH